LIFLFFWFFVCDAGRWRLRGAGGLAFYAFARRCFAAHAVWFICLCAGIRVMVSAVQASPLCGAAPTFLCRRKEK
jgi:hypothetical protein